MQVKFKNNRLVPYINLINGTTAKGRSARAVARFKKILLVKFKQYEEDEANLFKEFCKLDDNDEVIVSDTGTVTFFDGKEEEGNQAILELRTEEVVLDLTEFEPFVEHLIHALNTSEQQLYGEQMDILDELITLIENTLKGEDEEC